MRLNIGLLLFTIVLIGLAFSLIAQNPTKEKIAILPFTAIGVDDATLASAQNILRMEITMIFTIEILR